MAENSKIQWTHHTFNPWRGCTKVSDGCKNCYAEVLSHRNPKVLGVWGPRGTREVAAESAWREPVKWNRLAAAAGEQHRVFCASLADVAEGEDTMPSESWPKVEAARNRLVELICETPSLDWLLLTKRPENMLPMLVRAGLYAVANPNLPCPQPNIWVGTSVENRAAVHRIEQLRACPAVIRFLSIEPMMEDVGTLDLRGIHWVIVGGESGGGARPLDTAWVRSIIEQCAAAGCACFVKQLGKWITGDHDFDGWQGKIDRWLLQNDKGEQATWHRPILRAEYSPHLYDERPKNAVAWGLNDAKGGEISEWPEDLRVREWPKVWRIIPHARPHQN